MNIRIENSEFKILNFTSCKKFYSHCLANVELKPPQGFEKPFPQHGFEKSLCGHYIII